MRGSTKSSSDSEDESSGPKGSAPILDSGTPKDDGHHGSPPLDDFPSTSQSSAYLSGSKGLAQISDTAKDDFQSTSQSCCSDDLPSGPRGLRNIISNVASTDAVVTADQVVNLETEIALLRSALDAKDLELSETKVHAENYASKALRDSREKAEKTFAFQIFFRAIKSFSFPANIFKKSCGGKNLCS